MPRTIPASVAALALAVALAGCGGGVSSVSPSTTAEPAGATKPTCPAGSRASWQGVANQIHSDVYCPSWLPYPLEGTFGGPTFNGRFVNAKREYLVSFAWIEPSANGIEEVHVNLRGYPGRVAIPVCEDTLTVNGKTVHPKMPCYGDGRTRKTLGQTTVTVYTANQGADQWHILYGWHHNGSLYTLSEHVVAPYTHAEVVANLDRMMRGLVLVHPAA